MKDKEIGWSIDIKGTNKTRQRNAMYDQWLDTNPSNSTPGEQLKGLNYDT
jgi:hypothetical protein